MTYHTRQLDTFPAFLELPRWVVMQEFEDGTWHEACGLPLSLDSAVDQWTEARASGARARVYCLDFTGKVPPQNVTATAEQVVIGRCRNRGEDPPDWLHTQAQIDQTNEETRDQDRHIAAERADYRRVPV